MKKVHGQQFLKTVFNSPPCQSPFTTKVNFFFIVQGTPRQTPLFPLSILDPPLQSAMLKQLLRVCSGKSHEFE